MNRRNSGWGMLLLLEAFALWLLLGNFVAGWLMANAHWQSAAAYGVALAIGLLVFVPWYYALD